MSEGQIGWRFDPPDQPDSRTIRLARWCQDHGVGALLPDTFEAAEEWGANCGPMALAAALGLSSVNDARRLVQPFRGCMSPRDMFAALDKAGVSNEMLRCMKRRTPWPCPGLVRIQWVGPWCDVCVNPRAAYAHTHWIAVRSATKDEATRLGLGVCDLLVYDGTPNAWVPLSEWSVWCEVLWPKRTTDWHVATAIELATRQ